MSDAEKVIHSIVTKYPEVKVRQLHVLHPGADDDGLWFFDWVGSKFGVQIESSSGMSPFLVETDESDVRIITESVDETICAVLKLLHL